MQGTLDIFAHLVFIGPLDSTYHYIHFIGKGTQIHNLL